MFPEPMDVEADLSWELRPRKGKRTCEYLKRNHQELLSLPPGTTCNETKKICLSNTAIFPRRSSPPRLFSNWNLRFISRFIFNPVAIIGFLHVLLNLFLVSIVIYSICHIFYFAKIDIAYKIGIRQAETRAMIEEARHLYKINRCDPTTRVPALEAQCGKWECLIRNGFSGIKYTKIVAELFADAIDGFIGRFKIRNLVVVIVFVATVLIFKKKT